MQMIQDIRKAKRLKTLHYALFSQKAQKRTAVEFRPPNQKASHFISLPEITYCVCFAKNSMGRSNFYSLVIAHMKDGIPMYLPLHNVDEEGKVCFGTHMGFEGSIQEMAEYAVSKFWNSMFDNSYQEIRRSKYGSPLADFKSWAQYTEEHPDWIPEPNVPIEGNYREFFTVEEPPLPLPDSR